MLNVTFLSSIISDIKRNNVYGDNWRLAVKFASTLGLRKKKVQFKNKSCKALVLNGRIMAYKQALAVK